MGHSALGHHQSLLWMGGRLALSLLLVLALFLGAVWAIRFLQKKTLAVRSGSEEGIRICQTVVVAPKSTVSVVKVGSESFLLGVTPQNISLLARLGDKTADESPALAGASRDIAAGSRPPVLSASPARVADPEVQNRPASREDRFDSVVEEALARIRRGQPEREGDGGRRWSV